MNKKGFTLAELIVVITILAIISAIGFISLSGYNKQARDGKRVSDIRSILTKIMVEHSLGAPYEELIIFDYNNYPKINGDQELSYIGPANFIRLMEDPEKFLDPLTGNDYPFAYAYSGSTDTIYDFVQVATINESERKAVVMGNYYKMKEGDSPSLYVDGDKIIVDGGDTLPYDEDGKTGGGDNNCTFDSTDEDCIIVEEDIIYTGEYQTFIAPVTGKYKLQTWGAKGGKGKTKEGGNGGYSEGIITLNQGDILYVYVGGQGKSKTGGWNGGGNSAGTSNYGGGGGGATDIRFTVGDLYSRVIVAGGGGGGSSETSCGLGSPGGGINGKGGGVDGSCGTQAGGGTQISGGAGGIKASSTTGSQGTFGQGANSITTGSRFGGGGGGGWYGGGAGATSPTTSSYSNGGGGGSAFGWVKNTQVPGGYTVEAKYQLTDFITRAGDEVMPKSGKGQTGTMTGNAGDGFAKISYIKGGSSDKKPCRPKVINGYAVPRYKHGQIDWVTKETNQYGLHQIRKQLFECNDGTFIPGEEIIILSECNENYTYNEEAEVCEPATRTTQCDSGDLPTRAVWTNTNSNIRPTILTQTWNGTTWFPDLNTTAKYDTNFSATSCNYRCLNGYSGTDCNTPPGFELGEDTELIDICSLTSTVNPCVDLADDFEYTGNYQTFIAPITGVYRLETRGAQGGYRGDTSSQGGKGGYSVGQLTLTASTKLYIYVGGAGRTGPYNSSLNYGGWNGGGNREGVSGVYGGGGATDIRLTVGDLYSRLIVAGGGGSDGGTTIGTYTVGGHGGGLTGGNASTNTSTSYVSDATYSGKGGTQTAGGGAGATSKPEIAGSFGQGGKGIKYNSTSSAYGGAGGGGWYGGSGTYPGNNTTYSRGGGGGAGFVWTAQVSNSGGVPSGYNVPTSYFLSNTSVLAGNQAIPKYNGSTGTMTGNEGNGFARITILSAGNIGLECAEREINGIRLPKTDHGTVIILEKSTPAGTIPNGTKIIRQLFTCNNGNYVPGAEKEKITCDTNYELNVETKTCIPGTREIACTNLPDNAQWTNTSSTTAPKLSQTWNGATQTWNPSINETPTYSTTTSTTSCNYKCTSGVNYYSASDGSCNTPTKSIDCGGTRPANSTAVSGTTYTLTWNTSTKSYNEITTPTSWTLGGATCGYICNQGFSGASCTPTSTNSEDIDNYDYTGNYQIFIAPVTGIYRLEAWGAQGGYKTNSTYGGNGGYATGEVRLNKGKILYLYVGQSGTDSGYHGGWNGGGAVERNGVESSFGGGGATDIRLTVGDLYSRLVVAGGGGSQGVGSSNGASQSKGGAGGGITGNDASNTTSYSSDSTNSGRGGTQTAGGGSAATSKPQIAGSFGQGGSGTLYSTAYNRFGGAGGGGWYGGSGTYPSTSSYTRGGGGGAGFVWTSTTASNVPSSYNVPTDYYLSNAYTLAGSQAIPKNNGTSGTMTGKTGNGYVRITLLQQIDDGGEGLGNDCTQTTKDGYTIQNPPTAHGDITYGQKTESINYGTKTTTQGYKCNNGNLEEIGNPSEVVNCNSGYSLQLGMCIPEGTPTLSCTGLPSGAIWTYTYSTSQTIPQTWDISTNSWIPATAPTATYSTAGTASECRFMCDDDYSWNSSTQVCMETYITQNCKGTRPTNSTPIDGTTYTQTWNSSSKTYVDPAITTWTKGANTCGFTCSPGWTGNNCDQEADPSSGGDYSYTGNYEIFVAPKTGVYLLEVRGAEGATSSAQGGKGGYAAGEVTLALGTALYVYVGGQGESETGGWNGGGNSPSSGGGGASDMRFNIGDLNSRIIVAGGGGGGSSDNCGIGGAGGGTTGIGGQSQDSCGTQGGAGTQTTGGAGGIYSGIHGTQGSFGQGGNALSTGGTRYGGGGGGGWYGGGAGATGGWSNGGGGGAGFVWTAANVSNVPSGYSVPASMFLFNPVIKAGNESIPKHTGTGNMTGNTGNGFAKITLLYGYDESGANCTSTVKNGYSLPTSNHGTLVNGTRNQAGFSYGTKTYYQNFICNNGTFQESGVETNSITCYANYTLKEEDGTCNPETRVAVCTGLPTNAIWINTNSTSAPTTTQTWAGLGFAPSVNTTGSLGYNPDPTQCNYICKGGYSGTNCNVSPENENTGTGNGYTQAPIYDPSQKGTLQLKYIVGYPEYGNGNLDIKFWLATETGGYTIDWGDGTTSTGDMINNQAVTHTYSEAGVKDIKIIGHIKRFYNNEDRNSLYHGKLVSVNEWTNIQWSSLENMFQNAKNLLEIPKVAPDLTVVTNMNSAFTDAMAFNSYIGHWNVGNVVDMDYLFGGNSGARSFNRNITNWDTRNVSAMNGTFQNAKVFNQSIGSWNTSKVVGMAYMFSYADAFNSPLNGWNTNSVTNMSLMFQGASSFNQPLSNWNTSYVQRMDRMFQYATKFNQNIAAWETGNVTNMEAMFQGASVFDQNISRWNVSNVTNYTEFDQGTKASWIAGKKPNFN